MPPSTDILPIPQNDTKRVVSTVDRRQSDSPNDFAGSERRQFASSHEGLSPAGRELAEAIDHYKLQHRRRYITHDETLEVLRTLGYHR